MILSDMWKQTTLVRIRRADGRICLIKVYGDIVKFPVHQGSLRNVQTQCRDIVHVLKLTDAGEFVFGQHTYCGESMTDELLVRPASDGPVTCFGCLAGKSPPRAGLKGPR